MNNILKNAIKCLIFALPAVALVVPTSMFFPFITGKAFLFRVAIELAFCLYIALLISDRSFRPKWNALTISFAIFTLVMFVADAFAISPSKAFWSNFERMEGFVTLAHLFAYYIVASSVLKTKKDWKMWTLSTTAVSVYLVLFCFLQLVGEATINQGGVRVDGSLGNAAYLGAYLLFQFFFLLHLWVSEEAEFTGIGTSVAIGSLAYSVYYLSRILQSGATHTTSGIVIFFIALIISLASFIFMASKKLTLKYGKLAAHKCYTLLSLSYLIVLYYTATRGAILGLVGGVILGAVYLLFKGRESKAQRYWSIGALVVALVIVGGFYFVKDTKFVQNSPVLSRFASLSIDTKGQARNYIWPMAIQGFKEHPVLGWGQEGFNFIFQKYYVPEMITQEPWFDRAHNAFLDWLVAGGALGFFSYLALYVFVIVMVWKSVKLSSKEKAVIFALIAAYAFQNLFIFDNLLSYILFVSLLAFVSARGNSDNAPEGATATNMSALAACAAAFVLLVWFTNGKAYEQNLTLIQSISPQKSGINQNLALLKKSIAYNSLGTYEAREQLIRVAEQVIVSDTASNEDKLAFANAAVSEMDKEVKERPTDARVYLEYGNFLVTIGAFDQAVPILEKAESFSPKNQQISYALAKVYFGKAAQAKDPKQNDKAIAIVKSAYDLAPNLDASRIPYISALLIGGKVSDAVILINQIQDPAPLVQTSLIKTLVGSGHNADAVSLLKRAIALNNQNADAYVLLSDVYLYTSDSKDALKILEDMKAAIPASAKEADADIATIKQRYK